MAIVFESGFETGNTSEWSSTSATAPGVISSDKWVGTYSCECDENVTQEWVRHIYATEPAIGVARVYFKVTALEASANKGLFTCFNAPQSQDVTFLLNENGGTFGMTARIYDGVTTYSTTQVTGFALNTWYRVEAKTDFSGSACKVTWGTATGNGALTTHNTDFTGGSPGATTIDAWQFGLNGAGNNVVRIDAASIGNVAGDYPIGPTASSAASMFLLLGV